MNLYYKNKFIVSLNNSIIFFIGILTVVHRMTIFPYFLYCGFIAMLYLFSAIIICKERKIEIKSFATWYGIFLILIVFSYMYSVNIINPGYVMKRVLIIGYLALLADQFVKTQEKFIVLINGFIVGAIIVCLTVLVFESSRIGVSRVGGKVCGSAVAFSGIVLIGILCSMWKLIFLSKGKIKYCIITIVFFIFILLSGSRRAVILSILSLLLFILFNPDTKKSKKVKFLLIFSLIVLVICNIILHNETMYNVIGWRIESMIGAFNNNSNTADLSMNERNIMSSYAYKLFTEKPILGYGIHGFAYKFYYYYGKLLTSHTGFGEILACYGIVGFIIFYSIFIKYLKKIGLLFQPKKSCQVFVILYAIITFFSEFYTIAFTSPQVIVFLTVGLNILEIKDKKEVILYE